MEKKQFIKLFKDYMKKCGFIVKGNFGYLMVDHGYRISLWLDHPHRSSVPRGNSRVIITVVNALRTAGENFVGWLGGTTTAGITKCVSDSFRYSRLK